MGGRALLYIASTKVGGKKAEVQGHVAIKYLCTMTQQALNEMETAGANTLQCSIGIAQARCASDSPTRE